MEGIRSEQNISENKKNVRENLLEKYFNRHLTLAVLSVLLAAIPEKEIRAEGQKVGTQKVETSTGVNLDTLELDRKNAFEKFKALVEKEQIREKIASLKEIFGPVVNNFLSSSMIHLDLDILLRLEKSKDEENTFVNKLNPRLTTIGSIVSNMYKKRWERRKLPDRSVVFKNIDAVPGLSLEELKYFLDNTYSKNYISSSISLIEFSGQSDIKENERTEILGQAENFFFGNFLSLKINLPTKGLNKESFLEILKHEVGHANDWKNSPILTSAERISMLHEVYLRSVSKDRYNSPYVKGISLEKFDLYFKDKIDDDKIKEQYLSYIRATEYWAEIQKAYFSNKKKFLQEHPADYAVVKKWVEIISN